MSHNETSEGAVAMTPRALKELCRKDGLYSTAGLNDRLYAHYKGFGRIENLEAFTGLRVLWLEGNGLSRIEGLSTQTQLRTLYLHENSIEVIEGLDNCVSVMGTPRARGRCRRRAFAYQASETAACVRTV